MVDVSVSRPPAELDAVFFALSDQTRRGLLGRLRGVELTAGALADGFHVTRPAVSRHLRILREAHLVREKRRGRERVYTLTAEPLAGATSWLEDYRAFWSARLADLKALIEALPEEPPSELASGRVDERPPSSPSSVSSPCPSPTEPSPQATAVEPSSPRSPR